MRNKLNHFLLTDISSQVQLISMFPTSILPRQLEQSRKDGELRGCSQFIYVPLCCSFLCAFPLPWCGSLALWSFTNCGSFPWVKVQQDKPAPAWGVHESVPDRRTCSCEAFSPWTAAPARSLLLCGLSTGLKFLQGTSALAPGTLLPLLLPWP